MTPFAEQSQFIAGTQTEALALEPSFLSRAIDIGRNVMANAHDMFDSTRDAARSVGAVVLGTGVAVLSVGGLAVETSSALGDSQAPAGESATLTEAQCEAEVLQKPENLKGSYQNLSNPFDHFYNETFTLPAVSADCTGEGTRVATYFQEVNRDGGGWNAIIRTIDNRVVTTKVVPKINSYGRDTHPVKGNKTEHVHGLYRAPNFCVNEGAGLSNEDKTHHTLGRPGVKITWEPNDGSPAASQTFWGQANKICK